MTMKLGSELRVGDVVDLWFNHAATLMALRPYTGSLSYLWTGQAQIGTFTGARGPVEMTIEPDGDFTIVHTHDRS